MDITTIIVSVIMLTVAGILIKIYIFPLFRDPEWERRRKRIDDDDLDLSPMEDRIRAQEALLELIRKGIETIEKDEKEHENER